MVSSLMLGKKSYAQIPKGLLILGFGGHARSVADVALAIGIREIVFEDENVSPGEHFQNFETCRAWTGPLPTGWQVFGAAGNNMQRMAQHIRIKELYWPAATLIAPTATLGADSKIAEGCFIGHHAHVGPLVKVGNGCIINTGAVVEHESKVGRFSHISVNSTVAGRCTIGEFVFLGAGATVIDRSEVLNKIVIGAGAVVTNSLDEPGTYVGVPARRLL